MTAAPVSEVRELQAHRKLIMDVIRRQAGTLDKAILEGVMNGIEAGGTKVEVTYEVGATAAVLKINDNGKGIASIEEIEQFFETFGTPHTESEGKIWAQFRMGRGQIFSFGRNTWRTGQFQMVVDIEKDGLKYNLTKGLPVVNGCQIVVEMYQNQVSRHGNYGSIDVLSDAIRKQIEFVKVPVTFNGSLLSHDPSTLKWTMEDSFAYYLFGVGNDLRIYNLGAYVKTEDAHVAGTVGIIVSKKQLKVNFARNDIQSDDPIYANIRSVITANRIKKTRTRTVMNGYERDAALLALRNREQSWDELKRVSLFETTSGKLLSLDTISKSVVPWTFHEEGDRFADRLLQANTALVLDEAVLAKLRYTGDRKHFFSWLMERSDWGADRYSSASLREERINEEWFAFEAMYRTMDELREGHKSSYSLINPTKLTSWERRVLTVLNNCSCWDGRSIVFGSSMDALAWTDGFSYIALDRKFINELSLSWDGAIARVFEILKHEMAHDTATDKTHIHGEEFYRNFHDLSLSDHPITANIAQFYRAMQSTKIEQRKQKEIDRSLKADARKKKALGITVAADSVAAAASPETSNTELATL